MIQLPQAGGARILVRPDRQSASGYVARPATNSASAFGPPSADLVPPREEAFGIRIIGSQYFGCEKCPYYTWQFSFPYTRSSSVGLCHISDSVLRKRYNDDTEHRAQIKVECCAALAPRAGYDNNGHDLDLRFVDYHSYILPELYTSEF